MKRDKIFNPIAGKSPVELSNRHKMTQLHTLIGSAIIDTGVTELQQARRQCWPLYGTAAKFSIFVNLQILTGLAASLYLIMAVLDCCRTRLMARAGGRLQQALGKRVFNTALGASTTAFEDKGGTALRYLDAIQRWLASPAMAALFDLPWTPLFLAGIWIFHPLLGSFALAAGGLLVALALLSQLASRHTLAEAHRGLYRANRLSDQIRSQADMVQTMGIQNATYQLWQAQRSGAL